MDWGEISYFTRQNFATFDSQDVIAEDDEEDDIEVARQLADDWEVRGGEDEDEWIRDAQ